MKNVKEIIECTGCGSCAAICPQKIIKMELDQEGFFRPIITEPEKCTQCGLCLRSCPAVREIQKKKDISVFSASSKEKEVIKTCSSGGIAYEIAKYLSNRGYYLCGCRYNIKDKRAEHIITNSLEQFEECKGSKYIQSYTTEAISEMLSLLKNGEKAVLFGTPCQISAIHKIAEDRNLLNNLILVDFFCHGVPSYFLWEKYLDYLKKERNIENIEKVNFRDKNKGWHEFTMTVETKDGKVFSQSLKEKDWFFQFFLSNVVLNHACYNCRYRADTSEADIRIGDLWGEKYQENRRGVSGVLCFTEKGKELINNLKTVCDIEEEDIEVVMEEQMKKSLAIPIFRKNIIQALKKKRKFSTIYTFQVIPAKIYRKVKGDK